MNERRDTEKVKSSTADDILRGSSYALTVFRPGSDDKLDIYIKSGKPYLKCFATGKERPAKPEEIVRQLYIKMLMEDYGYPIFFATSQNGGKDTSGEYIYLSDDKGRRLYDLHSHPMVDHDLFNLRAALADQRDQRLSTAKTDKERAAISAAYEEKKPFVPDRPGIADAFRQWGRTQGFTFCNEDAE